MPFCAAFVRPGDAAAAALAAQRVLAAEDFSAVDGIRVRAAIHTGTADERDGDYVGPAVNRAARLLSIGHGGQVLVSGAASALLAGVLPPPVTLIDLGQHRLRDLTLSEHVYALAAPGLATRFPALKSLDALPNNLPQTANTLIGREGEVADITALLRGHRLVTVLGTGGVGKTRTALQVAANSLIAWPDGAWLIEFAPLLEAAYLPSTIANAFGLVLSAEGDPAAELAGVLAPKHALLLFDNCEHLVEPVARLAAALLRACPQLHILATSRQGLGLTAESTYRLPSLSLPDAAGSAERDPLTARAGGYAAIALFAERARSADGRFVLTDENAPVVADICRRVDGLPLAIELAASRTRILSPRQLREHLNERFRILTGGTRDALPRRQTIRALIDWSHDLLDDRERALFRRLAIFADSFLLEGAVGVGGGPDIDELDVFDLLASLVEKSLVLAEPDRDVHRYRLLESTRAYAGEKLVQAGERDAIARPRRA